MIAVDSSVAIAASADRRAAAIYELVGVSFRPLE